MARGIEFVKEFKAHPGEIKSVSICADGKSFTTARTDNAVMIFDTVKFSSLEIGQRFKINADQIGVDLLAIFQLDATANCTC